MSIKTLRKRIALVAVSALGAGFISILSAPIASADAGDINYIGPTSNAEVGICAVYDAGDADFVASTADAVGTLAEPLTVTVAVGGVVPFVVADDYFTYTAGGLVTVGSVDTAAVLHANYGLYAAAEATSSTFTANAVGTVTVTSYATEPFSAVNTPTTATASGTMTITVVASCTSASPLSTTYSKWQVDNVTNSTPLLTAGDTLTFGAGDEAYISMILKNAYNANLPTSVAVVASATNGATVKLSTSQSLDDSTTAAGTLSATSAYASGANMYLRVTPADLGVGGTTTVTVSVAGTTVITRTLTFLPEATKFVVVASAVGVNGGEGSILYSLTDAAGTAVPGSVSVRSLTLTPRISSVTNIKGASIVASDTSPSGQTINSVDAATAWNLSTTKYGVLKYTCQAGAGTGEGKVTLRHTTPVNAAYVDTEVTLKCAGGLDTYTVAMDKASYSIGEIATLTIAAKDSTGAAVNDFTYLNSSSAPDVTAGGATITKATATTDTFFGGVKTYKFQVTTAGTFNAVVNLPGTTTKSVTASYKVVDSNAGVTNAEVLAAIVKLIASINKQIKALQKSLKK